MIKINRTDAGRDRHPLLSRAKGLLAGIGRTSMLDAPTVANMDSNNTDLANAIESMGYAKVAPNLLSQMQGVERTNTVESNGSYKDSKVSEMGVPAVRQELTESEGLRALGTFLVVAQGCQALEESDRTKAGDMLAHMAFIGETEMDEATQGIAAYWKKDLEANPHLQILVQVIETQARASRTGRSQKSAGLVLERVLRNFTDKDLNRYSGRIIFDPEDISPALTTKAVLLDDWSISGTQLRQLATNLSDHEGIDALEANLVVATQEAIERGFQLSDKDVENRMPLKAYYKASNPSLKVNLGTSVVLGDVYPGYVTGSHSSVDFNHDRFIAAIVREANDKAKRGEDVPEVLRQMPPLTQVTRRYLHERVYSSQVEEINRQNHKPYRDKQGEWVT